MRRSFDPIREAPRLPGLNTFEILLCDKIPDRVYAYLTDTALDAPFATVAKGAYATTLCANERRQTNTQHEQDERAARAARK
jgi:hypothetical protein